VIERDRGRGWSVIGGDGWRDWTRAKFLSVIVLPFLSFVSSLARRWTRGRERAAGYRGGRQIGEAMDCSTKLTSYFYSF
jgi:hypothetical protein